MNPDINKYVEQYKERVDFIIEKFRYPSNIAHFLYVIVPAFIYYYGIDKEQIVLNTFAHTKILFSKAESKNVTAYYASTPYKDETNHVKTYKYVYLYNYDTSSLSLFLDNLVHEFNHAINSYKNEINIRDNKIYVRTGISYIIYDFNTLEPITKDKKSILEEVLNTKQTEDIINLILSITINNDSVSNLLDAFKKETTIPYKSNSYLLHSYICQYLLDNKAFKSTFNVLRLNGDVEDLENWFDNITGINKSYEKLINNLDQVMELSTEYEKKLFKSFTLNKIKRLNNESINLIKIFNENCNYK